MKRKSLIFQLFFLMLAYTVNSQVVDHVIFTEALGSGPFNNANYIQLTNVGDSAVNLNSFVVGKVWRSVFTGIPEDYIKGAGVTGWAWLPDRMLQPGESFVIAQVNDYHDTYYPDHTFATPPEILEHVDLPVFFQEVAPLPPGRKDSISPEPLLSMRPDRMGWFLEYHAEGDSFMVDAIFNPNNLDDNNFRTVAGIPLAYGSDKFIVRKSSVKKGNFNWDDSRGTNAENSEWLVLPKFARLSPLNVAPQNTNINRRWYTTLGHHGQATLDATTVSSSVISIDWASRVMTVPWGILRVDMMDEFELGPGLAWNVRYTPSLEDSTRNIVLTGDTLTMFAVGETLQQIDFRLEQAPPAPDMNQVFPLNMRVQVQETLNQWPSPFSVSRDVPEIDTVGSIGFRTRVDTLFKYLEKAPNASWEIVWVDGIERPDVKYGDLLKVTAENGSVKNYFLSVDSVPAPSSNAYLSAITWPDVPGYLRDSPQWREDTIPGFNNVRFNYNLMVPFGTTNVPALKAISANINAKVTEKRATRISGALEDRTTVFTVLAEDDSVSYTYTVTFAEEKPSFLVQSHTPDPFIARIGYRVWGTNMFIEIHNPGNQPLDLSDYMLIKGNAGQNPVETVSSIPTNFNNRYDAYIFGYDYQEQAQWDVEPAIVQMDLAVNPVVRPGESFVLGRLQRQFDIMWEPCDVIFTGPTIEVPEEVDRRVIRTDNNNGPSVMFMNVNGTSLMLFKILNDSIKMGTKGIGDIEDFELIEVFGDFAGTHWSPEGVSINVGNVKANILRKPQFWKGNPLPGFAGSWGNTPEESEWIHRGTAYYNDLGFSGFDADLQMYLGMGTHSTVPVTEYISTVSSYTYKVSSGYTTPQQIQGVLANTSVANFMTNIIKADPNQSLEMQGKGDDDLIADQDTLKVTSADGTNITKYAISLGALSSDAVLTSSVYQINIDGGNGTISGIPVGTSIKEVIGNVGKPQWSILNVINKEDNMVPLQVRNYDTIYVNTSVTGSIFFEVVAEDGATKINYQLQLNLTASDAFIFSDMFTVDQQLQLVSGIPAGIRIREFFNKITANEGAVAKLFDKSGLEVESGNVAWDDVIMVNSPDGSVNKFYALNFLNEPDGNLAYVLSDVVSVDQRSHTISDIQTGLSIGDFLAMLTPAPGASVLIVDTNNDVKADGQVTGEDKVRVISANGEIMVFYLLQLTTSIERNLTEQPALKVYPNPARDIVFIEGASVNSRIVLRNILGQVMKVTVSNDMQTVSIPANDLPRGVYFIYVQGENYQSVPVKLLIN